MRLFQTSKLVKTLRKFGCTHLVFYSFVNYPRIGEYVLPVKTNLHGILQLYYHI